MCSALPQSLLQRAWGALEVPVEGACLLALGLGRCLQAALLPHREQHRAIGLSFLKAGAGMCAKLNHMAGIGGETQHNKRGKKTRIKVKKTQIFSMDPLQEGHTSPEPTKIQISSSPTCSLFPFSPINM